MKKIFNFNFINNSKLFLIIIIFSCLSNSAYANCYADINFGADLRETQRKDIGIMMPSRSSKHGVNIFLPTHKHCPEENLGETMARLSFEDEKLYSKTIQVINISKKNLESKKKLLFNYVIRNYGNFKGSDKIDTDSIFKHWKINEVDVVYIKELNPNGLMREELTLFNSKYKARNLNE